MRQLLAECRRELRDTFAAPVPDPTAVLELSVQERLLQERLAKAAATPDRIERLRARA